MIRKDLTGWASLLLSCFVLRNLVTKAERKNGNVVCVFLELSYISLWSASRIIGRLRQILQVVSKMARRVIESHHGHLLIMIKSQSLISLDVVIDSYIFIGMY